MPETPLSEAIVWNGMTRGEIGRQYDTRSAVPDGASYSQAKREASERVRATLPGQRDVIYGTGPRQSLDVYPADTLADTRADTPADTKDPPILVYIHGGGWRSLDKTVYAFIAKPWCERGVTCVLPGYGLLPDISMDQMIAEVREAILWTSDNARRIGGDPNRIIVAGMSAGAQLLGMALADPSTSAHIRAAVLASGVYDLEPHRWHDRYLDMGLDDALVARASPYRHPPAQRKTPIVIAVGGAETAEFQRQSRAFHDLCQERGHPTRFVVEDGRHHFSMGSAFGEPQSDLFTAIVQLIDETDSRI